MGRGRRRDRDRLRPRRRADPELRPAAARDADRHQPRSADELPRRRARRRRRERSRPRSPKRSRRATAARDLAAVRADACSGLDAAALRFLDAMRFAVPADANVVVDMCIPGYWMAGFYTPSAPRRLQVPLGWGTLGYAFPAALGAALTDTGPTVVALRRRRLPVRLWRARDDGAGGDPADRRHRRRRRLRDAPLRPGPRGRGDASAWTSTRPTSRPLAASFGVWAETVFGPRRRLRRGARPPRRDPAAVRARRPAPRRRWSRRRTRRRTGTASGSRRGGHRVAGQCERASSVPVGPSG